MSGESALSPAIFVFCLTVDNPLAKALANLTPSLTAPRNFNVPNTLSTIRLGMAWLVFACIEVRWFWAALILFVIAVSTDWIDGWYARRFQQVTQLGRILDPFCDKVIICGTFIQLAAVMFATPWPWYVRIMPWMAVVVVARELLVTALRSAVEAAGGDFSASWSGKLKMLFQCVAAGACLLALALASGAQQPVDAAKYDPTLVPAWIFWVMTASIWAAMYTTLSSAWDYVWAAIRFQKKT